MLQRDGVNSVGFTMMTLCVPDEHCAPGLEVKILVGAGGITIGGELIDWDELDVARLRAKGCLSDD